MYCITVQNVTIKRTQMYFGLATFRLPYTANGGNQNELLRRMKGVVIS